MWKAGSSFRNALSGSWRTSTYGTLTRNSSRYAIITPNAASMAQWSISRNASEVMMTVMPTCAV